MRLILFLSVILVLFSDLRSQHKLTSLMNLEPNPFNLESKPINIALLPISNKDSLIIENFHQILQSQPNISNNFTFYSYVKLLQLNKITKIRNLSSIDPNCLSSLNELLNIKHVISLQESSKGLNLTMRNTSTCDIEYSYLYVDTDSSTAIKEILMLFSDGVRSVYSEKGRLELSCKPNDVLFTINATEFQIPFNNTLNPGNYIIAIKKEGFTPIKESIIVEAGKTVYKNYNLVEAFGKIKINFSPENVEYIIRKKLDSSIVLSGIGNIPLTQFQEGVYLFEIKLLGFTPQNRLFRIRANETLEETIPLNRSFYPIEKITSNEPTVVYGLKVIASMWEYEIQYDLSGSPSETYDVMLYLISKEQPDKKFILNGLQGDIGEDIKVGKGKKIFWNILKNMFSPINPKILKYSFYLEID